MKMKSSLSRDQQALLKACQSINFGRIERLVIRGGQPAFNPPPRIIKDVKLGSPDNDARPEIATADFLLKAEHLELFERLRRIGNGVIEAIEVRHGLPFRITFEHTTRI